jgi:PII-like signaling protein
MNRRYPAKLLRIHISESDRFDGKPLHEAIVQKCRELGIAGASVFRGLEGYGETGGMRRAHLMRHDEPIVITIVDSAENLDAGGGGRRHDGHRADGGVDVEVVRVQKSRIAEPGFIEPGFAVLFGARRPSRPPAAARRDAGGIGRSASPRPAPTGCR